MVEGRDAIGRELEGAFREGVEASAWEADVFDAGAAVSLERPPWRQRHYLHLSGSGVAAHWVYAAGLAAREGPPGLPPGVVERAAAERVESLVGGGNSGAALARLRRPSGEIVIVKEIRDGGDWLGRALGGGARSAELWRDGVLGRLPDGLDPAVLDAFRSAGSWWLVMRDVSAGLLGDERRLARDESARILALATEMHERFRGEEIPSLADPGARLTTASLAVTAAEEGGNDLLPKQFPAAWDAFRLAAPAVAGPIDRLVADPRPLVERLARGGLTLTHGDLRDDNLALEGERVVLLDWDMATAATPAVEFAWYLCHDAWRIDATHDEIAADFRAAAGDRVGDDDLALGLISGLVMYGWVFGHSALVHPDPAERAWAEAELAWWLPRAGEALERTGLAGI